MSTVFSKVYFIHFLKFWSNLHKMAKIKRLSINAMEHIKILFKESYFQRQTKNLKISRHEIQYSLQRQLRISENINRKRPGSSQLTTADEDKHRIIESERHRMKTALVLTGEFSSSRQQPILLLTVKNRLRSNKTHEVHNHQKTLFRTVNIQKRFMDKIQELGMEWAAKYIEDSWVQIWTFWQWERRVNVRKKSWRKAEWCVVPNVKHGGDGPAIVMLRHHNQWIDVTFLKVQSRPIVSNTKSLLADCNISLLSSSKTIEWKILGHWPCE